MLCINLLVGCGKQVAIQRNFPVVKSGADSISHRISPSPTAIQLKRRVVENKYYNPAMRFYFPQISQIVWGMIDGDSCGAMIRGAHCNTVPYTLSTRCREKPST